MPCWVDVSAPDPVAAAAFYRSLFGWGMEEFVARLDGHDVAALAVMLA